MFLTDERHVVVQFLVNALGVLIHQFEAFPDEFKMEKIRTPEKLAVLQSLLKAMVDQFVGSIREPKVLLNKFAKEAKESDKDLVDAKMALEQFVESLGTAWVRCHAELSPSESDLSASQNVHTWVRIELYLRKEVRDLSALAERTQVILRCR